MEVRRFELLTPCMPSPRGSFSSVHVSPNRMQLLGFQFMTVHRCSPQFISTAEVTAEVDCLRVVQRVDEVQDGYSTISRPKSSAATEWVIAPTARKSTPDRAT